MSKKSEKPSQLSIYEVFGDETSPHYWQRAIAEGCVPTAGQLAATIEANLDKELPLWFLKLVAQSLRGELKQKRGRPPAHFMEDIKIILAQEGYLRYLKWLQLRERRHGLKGWSILQKADWWTGPPHERAARMVRKRYLKHKDWRTVLNLMSSRK